MSNHAHVVVMGDSNTELISGDSALRFARLRQLLDGPVATATALSGGVSSAVFLIETPNQRFVLKQARAKLDVIDKWYANPRRTRSEAVALEILGRITPDNVPKLLDYDESRNVVAITAAPSAWHPWKEVLLNGNCDPRVGRRLGSVLARWHSATWDQPLQRYLEDDENFRELRLRPYFYTTAERRPDLAQRIHYFANEWSRRRRCLISGDFSPKNVLVGHDGLWVIDFEVACYGDPHFDVAFLLTHLLLKAVHLPIMSESLHECCTGFLDAYARTIPFEDPSYLYGLVGCLLLARVLGSSPVEYLTKEEARVIEERASGVISSTPTTFESLWKEVVA